MLNVKRKKSRIIKKQLIECVVKKDVKNIFYWVKKRLVWVFQNRRYRGKDNDTGVKERRP